MLTGKEIALIKAITSFCGEDSGCLIEEAKLYAKVKGKKFNEVQFDLALKTLEDEGYFDLIRCSRGEEKLLYLSPKIKAKNYERERKQLANSLLIKILFAVLGSVCAFLVTKILYGLF
ncbi:MAG: hypothetical protein E7360_02305 [Clostridiales bacterium]|nr:hypothetical protein [Clostridiales bacterium]